VLYLFLMFYKIRVMRIVICDIWRLMNLIPFVIPKGSSVGQQTDM